jgi:hypothetical protein
MNRPLSKQQLVIKPSVVTLVTLAALLLIGVPSARAGTQVGEVRVSLTVLDRCTMNTDDRRTTVACIAGGQYSILTDKPFATSVISTDNTPPAKGEKYIEIAF